MGIENIEPSNPLYTRDGLHYLAVYSTALTDRGCMTVYIPEEFKDATDLPMAILLHGVFGSEFAWPFMGGAHRVAQSLIELGMIKPMGLVMPSDGLWGRGSGYINLPNHGCEDWIVEDVPEAVMKVHDCFSEKSPRFIGGLSMGGFGALRLGMKHPNLYQAIGAHSSAMIFDPVRERWELPPEKTEGVALTEEDNSVYYWAQKNAGSLPPVRFDCGVDDSLLDQNRELHSLLNELEVKHTYEELPGSHSWSYWNEHLAQTLEFFSDQLEMKEDSE